MNRTPASAGVFRLKPHYGSGVRKVMNNIIYIIGLIVVVLVILSFLGLR